MTILVLGSGAVGVATAWYLNKAGQDVEVVERQPEAALETSWGNGGVIHASEVEPWSQPGMLPPIAVVFPIFLAYAVFGLSDSYPGLILLYTAFALPYVVWMMRGYLEDVPVELEEAALVDGYSHLSVLWRVTVPMARNGIIATAIFAFVFSWNEFLFALVLTRTEVITFTVQISQYFGSQSTFWAKIAAMRK